MGHFPEMVCKSTSIFQSSKYFLKKYSKPFTNAFLHLRMQQLNIAINGLGRIGRTFLRNAIQHPFINIVAVNEIAPAPTIAHLLKYDSVHRKFDATITAKDDLLNVNEHSFKYFSESNPENLPWKDLKIDIVVECTGKFTAPEKAQLHLNAGAKKVIVSAPVTHSKIPVICMGINEHIIQANHDIISNASCTTNNVAPLISILNNEWGIEDAYITTVHSYTNDQHLHDQPHKDLRRARAATQSIIPTSTGAAKAITKIFPQLEGKIGGAGVRVPVSNGSLTDLTCWLKRKASVQEINKAFKEASEYELKGILEYTEEPIVSVDILGNPHSCIFDAQLTSVIGNLVKVVGWYDNEWGYSNRLIDLLKYIKTKKLI
jgi:glyceraldehyde 3-phosphate dehydrogenase